jgi:hypothetical protein
MAFSSNILFYSLRAAHSGSYTCLASNRADTVNFTAQLIVKGNQPCKGLPHTVKKVSSFPSPVTI